mmetsp:Transcript_11651/g.36326  ORF Transcript_11651/g.36326 Transcript_11651/m.36326 type:complete len:205 (-) Transcript_11651:47-661(-)
MQSDRRVPALSEYGLVQAGHGVAPLGAHARHDLAADRAAHGDGEVLAGLLQLADDLGLLYTHALRHKRGLALLRTQSLRRAYGLGVLQNRRLLWDGRLRLHELHDATVADAGFGECYVAVQDLGLEDEVENCTTVPNLLQHALAQARHGVRGPRADHGQHAAVHGAPHGDGELLPQLLLDLREPRPHVVKQLLLQAGVLRTLDR